MVEIPANLEFASEIDFEYIINCAAFVGGVSYGYEYPAELLSINSAIANNVFKIAKETNVPLNFINEKIKGIKFIILN